MYYKMLALFRPMTSSVSSERYNHRTLFLIISYWPVYPRIPSKNPHWAFMFWQIALYAGPKGTSSCWEDQRTNPNTSKDNHMDNSMRFSDKKDDERDSGTGSLRQERHSRTGSLRQERHSGSGGSLRQENHSRAGSLRQERHSGTGSLRQERLHSVSFH